MNEEDISKLSKEILKAEKEKTPTNPLSERYDLSIKDAYEIQLSLVERKKEEDKEIVGKKIGLTSKDIQETFRVHQPDYGHIFNNLVLEEDTPINTNELIQPKIETEIGFILGEDLEGPGITVGEVLKCTEGLIPTFEVIDSRFKSWNIEIQDTIADNASIGRVIIGSPLIEAQNIDLRTVGSIVRKNGDIVRTAAGGAVLGNPAQSVAWLANKLSEYNVELKSNEIILSGSLISPIEIGKGDILQASFGDGLGSIITHVK